MFFVYTKSTCICVITCVISDYYSLKFVLIQDKLKRKEAEKDEYDKWTMELKRWKAILRVSFGKFLPSNPG